MARKKPWAITPKVPITTYGNPTALASARTPTRSGPEGSRWDIAGADRGRQEGNRLLGELLAELETLGDREPGGELGFLTILCLVDLRPLGLVAGSKKGPTPLALSGGHGGVGGGRGTAQLRSKQYNSVMASPVLELPNLAEPVTFTGADAERFLEELPAELSPTEEARLRESVRAAIARVG